MDTSATICQDVDMSNTNAKPAVSPAGMKPDRDSILVEWLEAEQDGSDHFVRHPSSNGVPLNECSPEIAADWNRVCSRRWRAEAKLKKYAELTRGRLPA